MDSREAVHTATEELNRGRRGISVPDNFWISVKEQLPDDPDEVVLVIANGAATESITFEDGAAFATYDSGEGWFFEDYPDADMRVSWWAHIPLIPTENIRLIGSGEIPEDACTRKIPERGNDANKIQEIIPMLRRLKVETGSLACLGCGHENSCSIRGCAILRKAIEILEDVEKGS